jgi:hypothetical protein
MEGGTDHAKAMILAGTRERIDPAETLPFRTEAKKQIRRRRF